MRHRTAGSGEISAITALMTFLAGTLGIGHLSGMAIRLPIGGPVPAITLLYLLAVIVVLLGLHADRLPAALSRMFEQAFRPQALAGGQPGADATQPAGPGAAVRNDLPSRGGRPGLGRCQPVPGG